ncbi:phosphoribosylglycinamide formyltransferase [Schizosaccharomyces cryophilus OY26]|uniref:Phosphoribosylglycinamide formyltransferase n=1 Tax=Schizosaccharomyces cryophilus (strain OY26 / ATCC MYA-4695 / CBS 11777 / NBRC 106824 / NRRL Y48691) TaxID=653667 RepID=S9XBH2_SCHCR|nr:phosphoribosylglycinamide formyltransferase [Schizosaccharomyces cryophilus OY26]EPY51141.1 phosphoribosylglycinamide formyltransferase [Schizosaccharomyces cryophilus OY26]
MAASLVVLISGSGSNLQSIIDATQNGILKGEAIVTHVLSNRKNAYGLERASKAGIPTSVHPLLPYKKEYGNEVGRKKYDTDLSEKIIALKPSLVVCAGWMHILSPEVLAPLENRNIGIINLHPALPGAFNGIHAIERAFEAAQQGKITKTGAMVHWVITEVDGGKPILVQEVSIEPQDTVETLENKIHNIEHKILVEAIHNIVSATTDA